MPDFSNETFLLQEIKQGNEQAFEYLFKNYYPRLRGYAIRFIEDEEAVHDIIQECFLKFWEKREYLSAIAITSFLTTIQTSQQIKNCISGLTRKW